MTPRTTGKTRRRSSVSELEGVEQLTRYLGTC